MCAIIDSLTAPDLIFHPYFWVLLKLSQNFKVSGAEDDGKYEAELLLRQSLLSQMGFMVTLYCGYSKETKHKIDSW